MEANNILKADILDIIFEGKNKSYGAYELRKSYNKRLTRALIITGSLLLLVFLSTLAANYIDTDSSVIEVKDVEMAEIKQPDEPLPPPPPPPPVPPPPPEIKQVQFVPPTVVPDEEVKPEEKIETIEEDAAVSTVTVNSENTTQIVQAPVEDKGTQVVEVPKVADDEGKVFTKVEVEAEFPGGVKAWTRFLEKNIDPETPVNGGAPPGTYQVVVQFIVSKDGSISDVQATTNHGFGMEAEAIKAIKRGPKWTPALQNGRHVNAYRRQPITYNVQE